VDCRVSDSRVIDLAQRKGKGLMKLMKHVALVASMLTLGSLATVAVASPADQDPIAVGNNGMLMGTSYQNDVSLPLYYLPAREDIDQDKEGHEGPENPWIDTHHVDSADPVVQHTKLATPLIPSPILNFNGIQFPGVDCSCAPPDTNGEVGETQYVQMVNEGFQVFDKATGNSVLGPQGISSVWAGFGGVCENAGHGDPVVLYDQLANRWLISQFAGSSIPTDECIAVSTTSYATGTWNRYAFHLGSSFFDYPHLAVWPDGIYMADNVFNSSGTARLGPQAFAFDRNAMIAGTPATFVTPGITGGPSEAYFLPGDLDGSNLPPNGAPNPFVSFPSSGAYKTWHFHADFATPGNSTFTLFGSPAAAGFTQLCAGTRACVPQLGGTGGNAIDGIGDRLMFRVAYRNFGDHESLVGNYSVKAGTPAGVRWFELRGVTAGPVSVFQESTYSPDSDWRWLGSIAMDSAGNIAVGFSASSATINPQLRYAGRLSTDPLNQLAQGEQHLFDGTGSQTGTSSRWGDYSALTVDPVDDCTFWYTNEYYATTSQFNWRTRIGNFKFAECGTPGFTLNATPADVQVCAGTPATYTVAVGSVADFDSPVTLAATGNPSPSSANFSPNPVPTLPGSSTLTIGNTAGVAAGSYPITINGTATGASPESTNVTLDVFVGTPGAPTLTGPANGASNVPTRPTFTWTGSNTSSYTIDVATDSSFTNIVYTNTVSGTTDTPNVDLQSNTQFFWRVTAANTCGTGGVSTTFSFTTVSQAGDCSAGTSPVTVYSYGFESGLNGWTLGSGSTGNTWADNTSTVHSGGHSYHAVDSDAISDQRFVSPSIVLPNGQDPVTLQFWHKRDIEQEDATTCYDAGILEISTNGGGTWTQLGSPDLLTDPYDGIVSDGFSNPLADLQAWCGVKDWTDSIVDVSIYSGDTVQFRYRLGSDSSVGHDGWYLDDVKVQSCSNGAPTHVVTPVAGPNGAIVPSTPQTVTEGSTIAFTVTPNSGFQIDTVTGCGGSLAGNTYTTAPITADCTVNASFEAIPEVTVTLDDGRAYAGYGQTVTYTLTITNPSASPVSGVGVSQAFPPELDVSTATWTCNAGGGTCTASGSGALSDSGVVVPGSGSVTYTLTANVLAQTSSATIDNQVTVTSTAGSQVVDDIDAIVLFRAGFELGDNGGNVAPAAHVQPVTAVARKIPAAKQKK
jgi:uncharacterized repeat protein (TIGR01451 family)